MLGLILLALLLARGEWLRVSRRGNQAVRPIPGDDAELQFFATKWREE